MIEEFNLDFTKKVFWHADGLCYYLDNIENESGGKTSSSFKVTIWLRPCGTYTLGRGMALFDEDYDVMDEYDYQTVQWYPYKEGMRSAISAYGFKEVR